MKNIHVLPTDKPSRLWVNFINGKFELDEKSNELNANHIYITSDEEIKEGDYGVGFAHGIRGAGRGHYIFKQDGSNAGKLNAICDGAEKIILTTDQDLIKDGVQAIDDDFLDWFVAHPSCEEIEVKPYHILSYLMSKKPLVGYRIIIPKEEPNYIPDGYSSGNLVNCMSTEEHNAKEETSRGCIGSNGVSDPTLNEVQLNQQQTLEDFIESQPYYGTCTTEYLEGIREVAKWQLERMYSDVDMINYALYIHETKDNLLSPSEWLKQVKKK